MSTTENPTNSSHYVNFDEYVDLKLQKAQSTIKTADLLMALAAVAAMFLSYLLVFVIFDQWIIPGGFGIGFRWSLLLTLIGATVLWLAWNVGRPYFRSINRLFAANEIEKTQPELKSNLLNLVDLRSSSREIDPGVKRALERHAALQLQQIDVTEAVDHRPLMRTAYVLLAVIAMFCLYAIFSPKKISNSIWRGLLPAANVGLSTNTEIVSVLPEDTTVLAHSQLEISAVLRGVIPDEHNVRIYYTSTDGEFRDVPVTMRADGELRFQGTLIGENGQGLLQDLTYFIRAGDATSKTYHVTIQQPPSASPEKVTLEFPAYMKLNTTEQAGGNIDSWEGTNVTLSARTNMPIKSAEIRFLDLAQAKEFNGDEIPMVVSSDGRNVEAKWRLSFASDGSSYARAYHINCKTASGVEDPQPIPYSIRIRPDLPPEIELLEPVRDLETAANAVIPILVQARDPDFELSHIDLHIEKDGLSILKDSLSENKQPRATIPHDLDLEPLGLKAGDEIELWVEALDNKRPRANRKNTPRLKVTILKPLSETEVQKQLADDHKQRDKLMADTQQEQNDAARGENDPQLANARNSPQSPQETQQSERRPIDQDQNSKAETANDPGQSKTPGTSGDQADQQSRSSDSGKNNKTDSRDETDTKSSQKESSQDHSTGSEKTARKQKPISPDGPDDEKVLEKLIEKLGQPPKSDAPPQDKKNNEVGRGSENDSQPPNSVEKQTGEANGEDDENKNGPPTPSKESQGNSPPSVDGQDQAAPPSPPNSRNKTRPKDGESARPESPQENARPSTEAKSSKPPTNVDEANKNRADDANSSESQKPKRNTDSERNEPDQIETSKSNSGPANNPKSTDGDPSNGDDGGQHSLDKTPESEAGRSTKQNVATPEKKSAVKQPGPGNRSESPPAGESTPDSTQTGEPAPGNPGEQVEDSIDSIKKTAAGTEKGVAKPQNDPTANPTPSKEQELTRDPQEKPANRRTETTDIDSNSPTKSPAKTPKTTPKKRPSSKTEQEPTASDGDSREAVEQTQKPDGIDQSLPNPARGTEAKKSRIDKKDNSNSDQPGRSDAVERLETQQKPKSIPDQTGQKQGSEATSDTGDNPAESRSKNGDTRADPKDVSQKSTESNPSATNPPDSANDQAGKSPRKKTSGPSKSATGQGADQQLNRPTQQSPEQPQTDSKQSGKRDPSDPQKGKPEMGKGPAGEAGNASASDSLTNRGSPSGLPTGEQPSGSQNGAGGQSDATGSIANGDGSGSDSPMEDGDAANLEYNKQATELVLKRLQDDFERGDVDPELLEQLGWTEAEMKRFTDRIGKHLQDLKSVDDSPLSTARRQQFEEMLKLINLKNNGVRRTGEKAPARDVIQIESHRATVPPHYRKASEQFSKDLLRLKKNETPSRR